MRLPIQEAIKKKRIYFDGATGSYLSSLGYTAAPEQVCLADPDVILEMHRKYISAGADIIKTNTFGVNPIKYDNYAERVRIAAELAIKAREGTDAYVALDIGPLGKLLSPLGDLDFEDAVSAFKAVITAAEGLDIDLILIETMNDSYETKAAVLAAKESSYLPIFVTNVYGADGKLMTGADPAAMACMLEGLGASAIGMNCSLGPEKMLEVLPRLAERTSLPIIVNPNAGLPTVKEGKTVYNTDAREFAKLMKEIAGYATILGGCCGTTPEYIKETRAAVDGIPFVLPSEKEITAVSSYTHAVTFGKAPVMIGERINPTGKPRLKEAIKSFDMDYIIAEAIAEEGAGAHVLDVNVGVPGVDEPAVMRRAISEISAVVDLPLQIDSPNPEALGAAMRIYNGKPLVNSVNGKQEIMDAVFPLVKKYGGVVIALTLDEGGIPADKDGRLAIAKKIISEAEKWGIDKKDIIVDPLAMAVSGDKNAALVTIDTVKELTALGIKTSVGVSNVSFGLPERDKLNAAYLTSLLSAGLTAAIVNPHSERIRDVFLNHNALYGYDEGFAEYISKSTQGEAAATEKPTEKTLFFAVRQGIKRLAENIAESMCKTTDAMEIINAHIIPALDEIGREFDGGRAYLPELIMSAEAAAGAFEVIKRHIPTVKGKGRRIVIATVKGDIHDIGKNIVKVVLESYGYDVIDLGRDVDKERILTAARESGAMLVGLSALMTTTVAAMQEAISLLKKEIPDVKIMVGGAVLTEDYAKEIGADYYAKDAMEGIKVAELVYGRNI